MTVGSVVRFFDYDYSSASGGANQRWMIGIVVGIWHPTYQEVIEENLASDDPWMIISNSEGLQKIIIPSHQDLVGVWCEYL